MHIAKDTDYLRRRAAQERAQAKHAGMPNVQRIHLELAAQYEAMIADTAVSPRQPVDA